MPAAMFPWDHNGFTNNPEKNRDKSVFCFDETRVALKDGGHRYVHASEVHLPGDLLRYVLTQSPLKNTLVDFWRLTWQVKPLMLVILSQPLRDEERYLPCIGKDAKFGKFEVNRDVELDSTEWWTTFQCQVALTTEEAEDANEEDSFTLRCLTWHEWMEDADVPSPERMLSFVQELHLQTEQETDKEERSKVAQTDVLCLCSTGAIRSGVIVAASALVRAVTDEAYHRDQIDRVVKQLREHRHRTIDRFSQYAYLHWLVLHTIFETPDLMIPGDAFKRLPAAIEKAQSIFEKANRQEKLMALR